MLSTGDNNGYCLFSELPNQINHYFSFSLPLSLLLLIFIFHFSTQLVRPDERPPAGCSALAFFQQQNFSWPLWYQYQDPSGTRLAVAPGFLWYQARCGTRILLVPCLLWAFSSCDWSCVPGLHFWRKLGPLKIRFQTDV